VQSGIGVSLQQTTSVFVVVPPTKHEAFIEGVPVVSGVAIGVAPALAIAGFLLGHGTLAISSAGALVVTAFVASMLSLDP
jgi:hypothetical protein